MTTAEVSSIPVWCRYRGMSNRDYLCLVATMIVVLSLIGSYYENA